MSENKYSFPDYREDAEDLLIRLYELGTQVRNGIQELRALDQLYESMIRAIGLTDSEYQGAPLQRMSVEIPLRGHRGDEVAAPDGDGTQESPLDVAIQLAESNGGIVTTQALANRLVDTGRYKSSSSAYGAAYSHLSRSERFKRVGRGEFRVQ